MTSMARASECGHLYELPDGSRGKFRKNCSKACQSRASYGRRREAIRSAESAALAAVRAATLKTCPTCGDSFTPERSMAQKFCAKKCAFDFHRDSSRANCSKSDCDRPVRAREMCSMHYRRWARAEGVEQSPAWDDRRRANYQKRRALKMQLPADDIRPADVFERDGWVCGLCFEEVPRSASYPDPLSPSLDHVLPLSLGGHHTLNNVQLAHLQCNVRKGARVDAELVPV